MNRPPVRQITRALLGLLLLLPACSVQEKGPRLDPFAAINPFEKFDPLGPPSPLASQVVAQWEAEFAKPDFLNNPQWHTRSGRDQLVYLLTLMADYRFNRYEDDLVTGKATRDTFVDIAVFGLSAAGALTNPGQATRILAAVSGGLVSSRAAIERNFYQNQAEAVLLRKMKVLRAQKLASITHHLLNDDVGRYPIERALIDVLDYYNRGTMIGALDAIAEDTAAQEIAIQGGQVQAPAHDHLPAAHPVTWPTSVQGSFAPAGGGVKTPPPRPTPSPTSRPIPLATPTPRPAATPVPLAGSDPLHERKKALIDRLPAMSDDAARKVAHACVPDDFQPSVRTKVRLQNYIRQTADAQQLAAFEAAFAQ